MNVEELQKLAIKFTGPVKSFVNKAEDVAKHQQGWDIAAKDKAAFEKTMNIRRKDVAVKLINHGYAPEFAWGVSPKNRV